MKNDNLFAKKDGKFVFSKEEKQKIEYKRVTINFEKEVAEEIEKLSQMKNVSVAKIVNDMAKAIIEDLKSTEMIEKPKKSKKQCKEGEPIPVEPGQIEIDEVNGKK